MVLQRVCLKARQARRDDLSSLRSCPPQNFSRYRYKTQDQPVEDSTVHKPALYRLKPEDENEATVRKGGT